jgi:hypothetical protein
MSHLNFFMDCKGYIMWHTTWDAHPMVQEESPGRMYLSRRIRWLVKGFVAMLWQCLESQRRRGYIQQLGDSHNYGTWRVRHELVVKRNDDSSSCLVSPLLADTVSPVQCPSFLLVIFRGRKQDISIAICISLLYFAWCIPHTIPVFVGWYLRAYQLLPPKTHIVAPKRDLCLPFNISGFVGWCIICLTIWNIQNQSCTAAYHNFHNQKVTFWKTVPSGKHTKKHWKWPIELVDLPINSMVMFHSFLYVYQRESHRPSRPSPWFCRSVFDWLFFPCGNASFAVL